MGKFAVFMIAAGALVAVWVTVVRPWLCKKPWADPFFDWVEPVERTLWKKSETILWARFQMVIGATWGLLVQVGAMDLSPLKAVVSADWSRWIDLVPFTISISGLISEVLRRDTTKPLAVVAMPLDAPPAARAAAARVDAAVAIATTQIKEAT